MQRTLKILVLALALLAAASSVRAQEIAAAWTPRTGDAWVDDLLDDINRYGQRYRDPFIDEMARYYSAPRALVSDLLDRHWAPGDVYYACALAQVAGQPCRTVADTWTRDHALGWGVITQHLGIQPGSAEFHRLKRGLVTTYDHWARPIRIDESLRADFPDRVVRPAAREPAGHDKASQARR